MDVFPVPCARRFSTEYTRQFHVTSYPVGRALTSDWIVNNFTMVVY